MLSRKGCSFDMYFEFILNMSLFQVVMSCDLGDGNTFRVDTNLSSKFALCDNRWHNVSAMYDSERILLRIDNQPEIINIGPQHSLAKVHTKSPLYIGGLPGTNWAC